MTSFDTGSLNLPVGQRSEVPPWGVTPEEAPYSDFINGRFVTTHVPTAIDRQSVQFARHVKNRFEKGGTGVFSTGVGNAGQWVANQFGRGDERFNINRLTAQIEQREIEIAEMMFGLDLKDYHHFDRSFGEVLSDGIFVRPSEVQRIMKLSDEGFDRVQRYDMFREQHPDAAARLEQHGITRETIEQADQIKSEEAFALMVASQLLLDQSLGILDRNTSAAGRAARTWQAASGFLRREFWEDPLGLATIPFALTGQGLKTGGLVLRGGQHIRRGGDALARFGTAPPGMARVIQGGGAGVQRIGKGMVAVEGAALARFGWTGIYAAEGATWGVTASLAAQNHFIERMNQTWLGTDLEESLSLGEVMVAGGIGLGAGWLLSGFGGGLRNAWRELKTAHDIGGHRPQLFREFGKAYRVSSQQDSVKSAIAAQMGEDAHNIAARNGTTATTAKIAADDDAVRVRNQKKLERLTGDHESAADDFDTASLFDKKALDEAGLTDLHVSHILDTVTDLVGEGKLARPRIREFMQDWYNDQATRYAARKSGLRDDAGSIRFRWAEQQARIHIEENFDQFFPGRARADVSDVELRRHAQSRAMDTLETMQMRRAQREIGSKFGMSSEDLDPVLYFDADRFDPWAYRAGKKATITTSRLERAATPLNEARVQELVDEGADSILRRPIEVERMSDGRLVVTDGNHRLEALRRLNEPEVDFFLRKSAPTPERPRLYDESIRGSEWNDNAPGHTARQKARRIPPEQRTMDFRDPGEVRSAEELADSLRRAFNLSDEEAAAIAELLSIRAGAWAKANGGIDARAYFQKWARAFSDTESTDQSINALIRLTEDGRKVIAAVRARHTPDRLRTVLHELGHGFSDELDSTARRIMYQWAKNHSPEGSRLKGLRDIELDELADISLFQRLSTDDPRRSLRLEAEEMFADAFTIWMTSGRAPSPKMESLFSKFKTWMMEVFKGVLRTGRNPAGHNLRFRDIKITTDLERVFAGLFNPATTKRQHKLASEFKPGTRAGVFTDVDTPPHVRARVRHLQEEWEDLIRFQQQRQLTPDEETRLLALDTVLGDADLLPVRPTVKPRLRADGMTKADDASDYILRRWKPTTEVGKNVQKLMRQREAQDAIQAQIVRERALKGKDHPDVKKLVTDRERMRKRVKRLLDKVNEGETDFGPTVAETAEANVLLPDTPQGRVEAARAYLSSSDAPAASVAPDVNRVATVFRVLGINWMARSLIDIGIGQEKTVRSAFESVRILADMIDSSRLKVEAMSAQGPIHVQSITGVQRSVIKKMNRVTGLLDAGIRAGKVKDTPAMQREIINALRGGPLPENKVARDMVKEARKIFNETIDDSLEAGLITKAQADEMRSQPFFPQRWQVGRLRKHRKVVEDELAKEWTRDMLDSEKIFNDVLVRMGLADRIDDSVSGQVRWSGKGEFAALGDNLPTQRSQLSPENQQRYTRAITESLDSDGMTVAQASAWRSSWNMLHETTYRIGKDGKLIKSRPRVQVSEMERRIDPAIINRNEKLQEFLDDNFFDVMHDYLRTTGFRAAMSKNLQRIPGIKKGTTFEDFLEAGRQNVEAAAKATGGDLVSGNRGISQLETKYLHTQGRLPRAVAESANVLEWAADIVGSGSVAVFGAGIGPIMLFTEVLSSMMNAIHSPKDFADNVKKAMQSIMAMPRGERMHTLKEFALLNKQYQHMTLSRYSGGEIQTGYAFSFWGRRINPWKAAWDTVSGRTVPSELAGGRLGAGATQAVRALGANMMDLHGARAFNIFGQDMLVATSTRELTTYMPAALKLARRLQAEPDILEAANRNARQQALDAGRTVEQAERAGNDAQFKLWQSLTREAGFPNWEVASRMRSFNLLDADALEAYMNLATQQGLGRFGPQRGMSVADVDWTEMAEAIAGLPAAQRRVLEQWQAQAIDSIEDVVRRGLSEPGPFNSLTDPAFRTAYGRMANIMFSYSRSWADNHMLALADRPAMRGLGTIGLFMFGDTLGRIARRILRGEAWEDVEHEFEQDPIRWTVMNALRTPMLGHTQPFLEMSLDSILGNRQTNIGSIGAGPGIRDTGMNLIGEALAAPRDTTEGTPRIIGTADKIGQRMIPIYGFMRGHLMDAHEEERMKRRRQRREISPSEMFD